jgi:hypothetical protein
MPLTYYKLERKDAYEVCPYKIHVFVYKHVILKF